MLSGCAKSTGLSTDSELYEKMSRQMFRNIGSADNHLVSLMVQHPSSPLIQPALLKMIKHHTTKRNFAIAKFYYKRYKERFFTPYNKDYLAYLELTIDYNSIKGMHREQMKVQQSLQSLQQFLQAYPR